eukprot:1151665-Pleurochrysis_carterae.AAC.2
MLHGFDALGGYGIRDYRPQPSSSSAQLRQNGTVQKDAAPERELREGRCRASVLAAAPGEGGKALAGTARRNGEPVVGPAEERENSGFFVCEVRVLPAHGSELSSRGAPSSRCLPCRTPLLSLTSTLGTARRLRHTRSQAQSHSPSIAADYL